MCLKKRLSSTDTSAPIRCFGSSEYLTGRALLTVGIEKVGNHFRFKPKVVVAGLFASVKKTRNAIARI